MPTAQSEKMVFLISVPGHSATVMPVSQPEIVLLTSLISPRACDTSIPLPFCRGGAWKKRLRVTDDFP